MKKIFVLLATTILLGGCVEILPLLGPVTSVVGGGGNIVQSTVSSTINYGVKKKTGKTPMQHALAYAEEKNPNKEKKRCISFVEKTNSEACAIAKKQVALTQTEIKKKTKNILKKISLINKDTGTKKISKTTISSRGQAFAKAKKEGKDSFIFKGKIYNTIFKESVEEKKIKPKDLIVEEKKNINKDLTKPKKSVIELALKVRTKIKEYDKRWMERKRITKTKYLNQ